eukprot:TRINITY_DN6877_c0_g1_i1.p1 TRINITY_DN6877_c0_g1~~TRINITY_DN6877_c0_g1_i1.p1  ORF type:complete len:295 (-),score=88.79 TRINITY_DN6877_c0_g1_i1:17-901(-)
MASVETQNPLPFVGAPHLPRMGDPNGIKYNDSEDPLDKMLENAEVILGQVNQLLKLVELKRLNEPVPKRKPGRPKGSGSKKKEDSKSYKNNYGNEYDVPEEYRKPRGRTLQDLYENSTREEEEYYSDHYNNSRQSRKKKVQRYEDEAEGDENVGVDDWVATELEDEIDGFKITLSTDMDRPWKVVVRDALNAFDNEPSTFEKILEWVNQNSFKASIIPYGSAKACVRSAVNVHSNWVKDSEGRLISYRDKEKPKEQIEPYIVQQPLPPSSSPPNSPSQTPTTLPTPEIEQTTQE